MAVSILTPAQVLQSPQEHLEQAISVRGYLIIWPGFVVSDNPLVMEFDAILAEADRTFHEMFWVVEEADYLPSTFLSIQRSSFGETVGRALGGYSDFGSRFLIKAPVVISASFQRNWRKMLRQT